MNLPNKLTVLRMVMVPFFVFFMLMPGIPHHYLFALVLFSAASITDHLDGRIARSRGLITNFGKLMDPLADKILVVSALICMVALGLTNAWFVIIIVAREFLVTAIRQLAVESGTVIPANNWGKAKTVSQMVAIITVLALQYLNELLTGVFALDLGMWSGVFLLIGDVLLGIAVLLTLISGWTYVVQNKKLFTDF
ncbi:MAG: CDP-diacylglycerol--glycerol-3-phosphate 3-phosphatidyltransferase [Clostridia bacterium]|nr:CDP-diacylglycerol--glycerol-3-phosphate 3-phosphatidyltransferase [Clostridia bacterium]